MALLTREEIAQVNDLPTMELEVPEWEGSVLIGTLTSEQQDEFDTGMLDKNNKPTRLKNLRARFAVAVLRNQDGTPMFTDSAQLGKKGTNAIARIWEEGRKFNKMDDEAVESAEENSEAAQADSSGTD